MFKQYIKHKNITALTATLQQTLVLHTAKITNRSSWVLSLQTTCVLWPALFICIFISPFR